MRVMNHNWSATKQRLHPQSVAEISRHSFLSGDSIRQCETSSGSRHKDTDHWLLLIYRPRKDERLRWPGWPTKQSINQSVSLLNVIHKRSPRSHHFNGYRTPPHAWSSSWVLQNMLHPAYSSCTGSPYAGAFSTNCAA